MTDHFDRCISIVVFGFAADPDLVADLIDPETDTVLRIGAPVGNHLSDRHRVTWRQVMFNDTPWDEGFYLLLERLGGLKNFKARLDTLEAPDAWLRINLPVVGSPWQESAGFGSQVIAQLAELNLGFDIAVFDYDAARPSHCPRSE
jgi:hypothetical protein